MDLSFTPNLDGLSKHVGLLLASFYSKNNNETSTNKTKLMVGNGTSAYLFQSETTLKNTTNNHGQRLLYRSYYVMINDNLVYAITFYTFNQPKFLPLEQKKIMESFRFIRYSASGWDFRFPGTIKKVFDTLHTRYSYGNIVFPCLHLISS
jgi:hypothetical protein